MHKMQVHEHVSVARILCVCIYLIVCKGKRHVMEVCVCVCACLQVCKRLL